jgi:hypothetical protein
MALTNPHVIPLAEASPAHSLQAYPGKAHVRIFGVDYICFGEPDGGLLYVTEHGCAMLDRLWPDCWYADQHYKKRGARLPGGTGTVYRVESQAPSGKTADLVVKFSRFAREMPLMQATDMLYRNDPAETPANAPFNSPFEEFGRVMDLRRGRFGSCDIRIRTKRPLAIYSPGRAYKSWQLGRADYLFDSASKAMLDDQRSHGEDHPVALDPERQYVLLFQWVKGEDAQAWMDRGLLTREQVDALVDRSYREMRAKGFYVIDHKPRHLILRLRGDGRGFVEVRGKMAYALVDFELLKPTKPYLEWLAKTREQRRDAARKGLGR